MVRIYGSKEERKVQWEPCRQAWLRYFANLHLIDKIAGKWGD